MAQFDTTKGMDMHLLVFNHLDRMSKEIIGFEITKPGISKIFSYHVAIQHFENLMLPFLDEPYYQKKEEHTKNVPKSKKDLIRDEVKYFLALQKWMKLLIAYAFNNQILRVKGKTINVKEGLF